MEETIADFSGKVVWLEIAGAPAARGGILMEYVEFRNIAGRVYLVGRMVEGDISGWLSATEAGVAWDAVIHYLLFTSREDYEKRSSSHKPSLRERIFGR